MSPALDIALRYLRSGRQGYVSFITWVSFGGLLLGVLVLTVVVSVMNGFDHELKTRLLQAVPHVVIEEVQELSADAFDDPVIAARFPYFETTAMVSHGNAVQPVSLLGLDQDGIVAMQDIATTMVAGDLGLLMSGDRHLVLGAPLARHLGISIGDRLTLTIAAVVDGRVRPQSLAFRLGGTFALGSELDYGLVLVGMQDIPPVIRNSSGARGFQLRLVDPLAAVDLAARLQHQFPALRVSSWTERYGELFRAVQLEKAMMFVLLFLVVAIAAFNIISGQVMLIREKTSAIAILRTMGATATLVSEIFLYQGLIIALLGITSGLAFGILATININGIVGILESMAGMSFLEGTYFVEIPYRILPLDLVLIAGMAVTICLLAAWIPAQRARHVHPVEGLHGF